MSSQLVFVLNFSLIYFIICNELKWFVIKLIKVIIFVFLKVLLIMRFFCFSAVIVVNIYTNLSIMGSLLFANRFQEIGFVKLGLIFN